MDFTALQTRVAEETGLDLQNADDTTSIKAWINQVYQKVSSISNWDWLLKPATITTRPDITTGTATISAYGSSVTLSVAPSSLGANLSVANQWMINFPSVSQDWYFISSHTSASTTLVLASTFVSSSNLTAGSYTLRKILYTLPTDLDKLIDIREQVNSNRLTCIDPRSFDALMPNPTATGNPLYYRFLGRDTSTSPNWQIGLFPTPTTVLNLQLKYYRHITELVSGTDEPLMPKNWHDIIIFGALFFYGHPFIDDDRLTSAGVRYKDTLASMEANCSHVPDHLVVMQPWDARSGYSPRRPRLPSNYANYYGL